MDRSCSCTSTEAEIILIQKTSVLVRSEFLFQLILADVSAPLSSLSSSLRSVVSILPLKLNPLCQPRLGQLCASCVSFTCPCGTSLSLREVPPPQGGPCMDLRLSAAYLSRAHSCLPSHCPQNLSDVTFPAAPLSTLSFCRKAQFTVFGRDFLQVNSVVASAAVTPLSQ